MAKATPRNYKFIIMSKIVKSQAHRYGTDGIGHNSQRNETCTVPLREKRRIAARNRVGESLDKRLAVWWRPLPPRCNEATPESRWITGLRGLCSGR
jgi:hypothetical protein